jgi:circadian clock protein KaiC
LPLLRSVGLDLERWVKKGLLSFQAARPTSHGLEMHLAIVHKTIAEFKPQVVVVDPVTNLLSVGAEDEVKAMLTRLIDYMKSQQVTGLFTSLTDGDQALEKTDVGISSLMDTWILLRNIESDGERNRGLYVLKSRGMAHSNQIREFRMSKQGIELIDAYLGPAGVLTGTARLVQEAREKAEISEYRQEVARKQRELERNRKTLEAQIAALKAEFAAQEEELNTLSRREVEREEVRGSDRLALARSRHAELPPNGQQGAMDEIPKQKDEHKKKTKARRSGR